MLHGQVRYNIASRFLDELPKDLLQWLSARERRRFIDDDWFDRPSMPMSAAAASRPGATPPAPLWRIGQSVRHAKFGLGVIIDAEGRGNDARVQVNFRDAGVKWLALEFARLEAA